MFFIYVKSNEPALEYVEHMGTFRSTALPPIYPLASLGDAFTRLYFLEKHIRAADKMLARRFTAAIDEMRVRLENEFSPLFDAVLLLTDELPKLDRCVCGKISHSTRAGAERQALSLYVVNTDPSKLDGKRLRVYACGLEKRPHWHVGHSRGGGLCRIGVAR